MCIKKKQQPLLNAVEVGAMKALVAAYNAKILPTEIHSMWSSFDTPPLRAAELEGIPVIMLLGQYSVGKTSMIQYLLNGNYPGANIGPEPTTDFFAHITYSNEPKTIPGVSLASNKDYQFQTLGMFGDIFLNKLRCVSFNSDLLKYISIIDTPGILTGEKQVAARGYDFAQVIKVLATKVDRIYLMFDANKLDISDEYKEVIQILEGHEEKVKIILNKADSVTPRELVHVRGALMWALGKIMKCSEIPKVYIGSFWANLNVKSSISHEAILEDLDALIEDIVELPNVYQIRRVNDVVKRARNLQLHTYIIDEILRATFLFRNRPDAVKNETSPISLTKVYSTVSKKYRIVRNDFPDPVIFHEKAKNTDCKQWKRLDRNLNKLLENFFNEDVPSIMSAAIDSKKTKVDYNIRRPSYEAPKANDGTQDDSDRKSAENKEIIHKEADSDDPRIFEEVKSQKDEQEMKMSSQKDENEMKMSSQKDENEMKMSSQKDENEMKVLGQKGEADMLTGDMGANGRKELDEKMKNLEKKKDEKEERSEKLRKIDEEERRMNHSDRKRSERRVEEQRKIEDSRSRRKRDAERSSSRDSKRHGSRRSRRGRDDSREERKNYRKGLDPESSESRKRRNRDVRRDEDERSDAVRDSSAQRHKRSSSRRDRKASDRARDDRRRRRSRDESESEKRSRKRDRSRSSDRKDDVYERERESDLKYKSDRDRNRSRRTSSERDDEKRSRSRRDGSNSRKEMSRRSDSRMDRESSERNMKTALIENSPEMKTALTSVDTKTAMTKSMSDIRTGVPTDAPNV